MSKMKDLPTFVSSVEFGFTDESRTVAHVAAQESVGRIGVSTAHVALDVLAASTIMALIALVATASEKR